ncbi:hypothetical protein [Krasilnikovia sp. MM14-A1259]|uniref:hypothetical protein n=1 Tax=Krasilnikovia sp. MM14-A1259 TaxID=3373539 RepID=UPI00382D919D
MERRRPCWEGWQHSGYGWRSGWDRWHRGGAGGHGGTGARDRAGLGTAWGAHLAELVLQGLHTMVGGPGRRGDLTAQLLAQGFDLGGDAVLDVHPHQHRVVADQQRGSDEHDTDRDEQDRDPHRRVAPDQCDDRRDRSQPDAGPDEKTG